MCFMNALSGRLFDFEKRGFPSRTDLFAKLVADGQGPKALMISCADSRVAPEHIMQAEPGDMFVCRNAGNIVPPFATQNGGVSSTVEYAVAALGVRDIIVCGHSDCGAMKALMNPHRMEGMPNVAARSEEHTSELQSLMRISYAVFCLKKKKTTQHT